MKVEILNRLWNPEMPLISSGCKRIHKGLSYNTCQVHGEMLGILSHNVIQKREGPNTFKNVTGMESLLWKLYRGMMPGFMHITKRISKIAKQVLSKTFSDNTFSPSMPIWKGLSDSGICS